MRKSALECHLDYTGLTVSDFEQMSEYEKSSIINKLMDQVKEEDIKDWLE